MHRAFGSWVMIRVVCSLISALAGAEPRLFRHALAAEFVSELLLVSLTTTNAAHFRPSVQSNPFCPPRLPFRVFEHLQQKRIAYWSAI